MLFTCVAMRFRHTDGSPVACSCISVQPCCCCWMGSIHLTHQSLNPAERADEVQCNVHHPKIWGCSHSLIQTPARRITPRTSPAYRVSNHSCTERISPTTDVGASGRLEGKGDTGDLSTISTSFCRRGSMRGYSSP